MKTQIATFSLIIAFAISSGKISSANSIIYSNDFEAGAGPEWLTQKRAITPVGERTILGDFGNEAVTLTLTNLPAHANLHISFDLFLLGPWHGYGAQGGPDSFDFRLAGTTTPVLRRSFSNLQDRRQSYPNGDSYCQMGASEVNTFLGTNAPSSVYNLSFDIAHSTNGVTFQFEGVGLSQETWGLDNVIVAIGPGPTVAVTNPVNTEFFTNGSNIAIEANAHSTNDPVETVQFYANQALLTVLSNAPFNFTWGNAPAGMHALRVRATAASGLWHEAVVPIAVNGLLGEYYGNTNFSGAPIRRVDPGVNIDFGTGAPIPGIRSGGVQYSVRWTGLLEARYSESYTFTTDTDDGGRLWIDDQELIDNWSPWKNPTGSAYSSSISLQAGRKYRIRVDYYNGWCCGAWARLFWSSPSQPKEIVPPSQLSPVFAPMSLSVPMTNVAAQGSSIAYTVSAFGASPMNYEWYRNGEKLLGSSGSTLSLTNLQYGDAGVYSVAVSNSYGGAFSIGGELSVLDLAASGQGPELTIGGPAGRQYRIEYTPDLMAPRGWQTLTNIGPVSNPVAFPDPVPLTSPDRFYRAVPLP